MNYYKDYSLLEYNTFHVDLQASGFYKFDYVSELQEWLQTNRTNDVFVLGGGSNVLFTKNFEGTIIYPSFKGIEIEKEEGPDVWVRFAAGEEWDHCVEWAVEQGLGGIENLSYIPGNIGAAPIQNIGAYGVELSDVMVYTEGFYLNNGNFFRKNNEACNFDYRYSIFKGPLRNKVVITSVVLRLSRKPQFQLDYGSVKEMVNSYGEINLTNIRKAIIEIRREKLPDPNEIGNAGSFFKNPVIPASQYSQMQKKWNELSGYPLPDTGMVKIPAGWLIEKCGWKGKRMGNAGVHTKQALVIVNNGGATAKEIIDLAKTIQNDVFQKFGVEIEPEVNIIS